MVGDRLGLPAKPILILHAETQVHLDIDFLSKGGKCGIVFLVHWGQGHCFFRWNLGFCAMNNSNSFLFGAFHGDILRHAENKITVRV